MYHSGSDVPEQSNRQHYAEPKRNPACRWSVKKGYHGQTYSIEEKGGANPGIRAA
jgi:hypothetical protein